VEKDVFVYVDLDGVPLLVGRLRPRRPVLSAFQVRTF
jgi:hypothetical protein